VKQVKPLKKQIIGSVRELIYFFVEGEPLIEPEKPKKERYKV